MQQNNKTKRKVKYVICTRLLDNHASLVRLRSLDDLAEWSSFFGRHCAALRSSGLNRLEGVWSTVTSMKMKKLLIISLLAIACINVKAGQCLNPIEFTPATEECDGYGNFVFIEYPDGSTLFTNGYNTISIPYFQATSSTTNVCYGTSVGNLTITVYGKETCCNARLAGTLSWWNVVLGLPGVAGLNFQSNSKIVKYVVYFSGDHCDSETLNVQLCAVGVCDFGGGD